MKRENALLKTKSILMNKAVSAVISKEGGRDFKKTLDEMGS